MTMQGVPQFLLFIGIVCLNYGQAKPPNIVFILTDDQDVVLGGMTPMTKTKKLIGDEGVIFENMFVNSPLCCPSRSSILTGRYNHNQQALNNSLSGNCSSPQWQLSQETQAFITYIRNSGYQTFFAGKYLNQYGTKAAGGVEHVPPGWDEWNGLVGNSRYYNYTLSVNGRAEKHGDTYSSDYLTDLIGRKATKFLEGRKHSRPFFMMLATPACHAPFTPAPQYSGNFSDVKAPRNGSFNVYSKDKHWLIRQAKNPMSDDAIKYIDRIYKDRWRTLLTVDDLVESVYNKVKAMGELNNTYFVFSSDNGYHMGQFSLIYDKRELYETDIRVPLMIRGPGIKPGQVRKELVMNIDLAPTFIQLAGGEVPYTIDGQSLVPLMNNSASKWRTDGLIEHIGEFESSIPGCPQYKDQNMANCEVDCVCNDSMNNTYACLRVLSDKDNLIVCQFSDAEDFMEVYDLTTDPHQLKNIVKTTDPKKLVAYNQRLIQLMVCTGYDCHTKPNNRG